MIIRAWREEWPLREAFTISRGSRVSAEVVVVSAEEDGIRGLGECTPYGRYGESPETVITEIMEFENALPDEAVHGERRRTLLQETIPAGAARNALDAAFWDLQAKQTGVDVRPRLGLGSPKPIPTFVTLSADTPRAMAAAARRMRDCPRLKLKLTGTADMDRVAAVREVAPDARIMLDANEAWSARELERLLPRLQALGVSLVEQPLPVAEDDSLEAIESPVPLCADESVHDRATLPGLVGKYDFVNVKLDKTGGLTEALAFVEEAKRQGFGLMLGCMIGTSLALAPALLLADEVDVVDLDAPLFLNRDRVDGLTIRNGVIEPSAQGSWGVAGRRWGDLDAGKGGSDQYRVGDGDRADGP